MTYRTVGAVIAGVSAVALMLGASETFARSGAAPGGGPAGMRAGFRPPMTPQLQRQRGIRAYWPATGGYYYGPNGEPIAELAPPSSGEIDHKYTYSYDVPWDWAHRYPPNVIPSERAYITECPTQAITVPGAGGGQHTVNITRCY